MSSIANSSPVKLNQGRARFVLDRIDEILSLDREAQRERDSSFVVLGRYLCEVRAHQYWRLEGLASFDDFLARRFPESRRKAFYLMSIHLQLPKELRSQLTKIGWSKCAEMAKVARHDRQEFESANWLHKAKTMPVQDFRQEVDRYLTGVSEPAELMTVRVLRRRCRLSSKLWKRLLA